MAMKPRAMTKKRGGGTTAKAKKTKMLIEEITPTLTEQKNTHMEHVEEEILNRGREGGEYALQQMMLFADMLKGRSNKKMKVSVKWDGAPAIVCGIDPESGKFFVGTKGVFSKKPKLVKVVPKVSLEKEVQELQEIYSYTPIQEKPTQKPIQKPKSQVSFSNPFAKAPQNQSLIEDLGFFKKTPKKPKQVHKYFANY